MFRPSRIRSGVKGITSEVSGDIRRAYHVVVDPRHSAVHANDARIALLIKLVLRREETGPTRGIGSAGTPFQFDEAGDLERGTDLGDACGRAHGHRSTVDRHDAGVLRE